MIPATLMKRRGLTAFVASMLLWNGHVAAKQTEPLPIEALLEQAELRGPAVSPDEQLLAYSVCQAAKQDLTISQTLGQCALWITERATGRTFRVSEGAGLLPSWSPDSGSLAFQGYEGDELRLWLWHRGDAKARQLSKLRLAAFGQIWQPAQWSPDGRRVMVKHAVGWATHPSQGEAIQQALPTWARENRDIPLKVRASNAMAEAAQRTLPAQAAGVPIHSNVGIALVDVATGEHRIVREASSVTGARLSPDGSKVLFSQIAGKQLPDAGSPTWDLGVIDIETGRERMLARDIVQYHGMTFSWSPDNQWVAYLSGPAEVAYVKERGAQPTRLTVVAVDGNSRRTFDGNLASDVSGYEALYWACDARTVGVVAEDGLWIADVKSTHLRRLASLEGYLPRVLLVGAGAGFRETAYQCAAAGKSGEINVLARERATMKSAWIKVDRAGKARVVPLQVSVNGWDPFIEAVLIDGGQKLIGVAQAADLPPEIFEFDTKGMRAQLTRFNQKISQYELSKVQLIDFDTRLGRMKAAVMLPVGYEQGRRYPAVLEMYPGAPMAQFAATTFGMIGQAAGNAQMLATRGYAVVVLNSEVAEGTLAQDIADTAHAAVDELLRRGWVDPDRLALRGCSHAGYAVLATLMNSDRFKAGVAECAFGDLGAFLADGWKHFIQQGIGRLMLAPWEDPQRYVENSPFYHADRIKAPLMLVVGGEDGVFVPQSEQMFYALDELGREVTLLTYEKEAHGLKAAASVADFWPRLIAFLDAKLKRDSPQAGL